MGSSNSNKYEFQFIAMADLHMCDDHKCSQNVTAIRIRDHIRSSNEFSEVKFIVMPGDLSNHNFYGENDRYHETWKAQTVAGDLPPICEGLGNHDTEPNGGGKNANMDNQIAKYNLSRNLDGYILDKERINYSWYYKPENSEKTFHFIMLSQFPGTGNGNKESKRTWGALRFLKERLELINKQGKEKNPIFLFHHYGFSYTNFKDLHDHFFNEKEMEEYITLIKDYNIACICYGHLHGNFVKSLNQKNYIAGTQGYVPSINFDKLLKNTPYFTPSSIDKDVNISGINLLCCGGTTGNQFVLCTVKEDFGGNTALECKNVSLDKKDEIMETFKIHSKI